jgi:putative ATP-binding cassette transporter
MGLSHLAPELDRVARWDSELTGDEQQNLAFSRLLLQKPRWVLMDEAIDRLDDDSRRIALDIFHKELAETAVVHIGRLEAHDGFYARVLRLTKDPEGVRLTPCAQSRSPTEMAERKAAA